MTENFRDLLVTALPELRGYARKLTRDRDDADDLLQDTALKALRYQANFVPGTNIRGWLCTIMRNQFLDNRRRLTKRGAMPDIADIPPEFLAVPGNQIPALTLSEVNTALDAVTPRHREALIAVALHGMPYGVAADFLDVPCGTVRSRVHRAREELRQAMGV